MPRKNRKPEIITALSDPRSDPIKVAEQFGVTPSYVYHLDKKRREGFANANKTVDYKLPTGATFKELSVSSLRRHGGDVAEEYLRELQGQRGIQLYKEMGNDPVIAAVIQAIKMTLRRVQWYAVAPKSGREDEVDFLNQCMDDMSLTFADFIDQSLSMLQYGFSPFETIYKPRKGHKPRPGPKLPTSRFDDNKIGWRKFALIGQDTLAPGQNWIWDEDDGSLKGLNQMPPVGTIYPLPGRQMVISIPIEKMILFRTTTEKGNPEGRSLLRAMYPAWYYAKNLQEIEAISAERTGAGFPVFYLGDDISKSTAADAEISEYRKAGRNLRVDEQMSLVIPHAKMGSGAREGTGVLFEFAAPPVNSRLDFGKIIERYEKRIAMVGLAQFIHLGMGQLGSQGLAQVTTDFFQLAVSAWADSIRDTINRFAVMPLLQLNSMNVEEPVIIEHGNVAPPDLKVIADYINKTVGAKAIEPDELLEDNLRKIGGFPEKDNETVRPVMVEVSGDGGTRTDRTGKTQVGLKQNQNPPANNQRNQNPRSEKPQEPEQPEARKPMRASEGADSETFEENMNSQDFAVKIIEGMSNVASAMRAEPPVVTINPAPVTVNSAPVTVNPAPVTIYGDSQDAIVDKLSEVMKKMPQPKIEVAGPNVTVAAPPAPNVNIERSDVYVQPQISIDTTPIAKELRAGLRDMLGNWIEKFADMVRGQSQPVINIPPAQVIIQDNGPDEMTEEQDIVRDPKTGQMKGTRSHRVYKHKDK